MKAPIFDARGNRYAVASQAVARAAGIALPDDAAEAAKTAPHWTRDALARLVPGHDTDGLILGPFGTRPPFACLIVNSDGSLAERSGNGLTIFAAALAEAGLLPTDTASELRVHHEAADVPNPTRLTTRPAVQAGAAGFWIDMGVPAFGPAAVAARAGAMVEAADGSAGGTVDGAVHIPALAAINRRWGHSLAVRIGNPHAVTWLDDATALPSLEALAAAPLRPALTQIAFAAGSGGTGAVCPAGINLQWAAPLGPRRLAARIFERGEGPTASSGSSATAVALAAWRLGLVGPGLVEVAMPGGTAPILLEPDADGVAARLFGVARRLGRVPI